MSLFIYRFFYILYESSQVGSSVCLCFSRRQDVAHLGSIEEEQNNIFITRRLRQLICGAVLVFVCVIHGLLVLSVTYL